MEVNDLTKKRTRKGSKVKNAIQKQFLANISHEIKTPLNGIIGMSHLLEDTQLTEEQQSYLSTIQHSSTQLKTLINDVLDFAKIDKGQWISSSDTVDLRSLIENLVAQFEECAAEKNLNISLKIESDVPKEITTDVKALNKVLSKLIDNAVKYTKHGSVDLSISLVDKDDKHSSLQFEIQDTGVGISPQQIDQTFEAFQRILNKDTSDIIGPGLGLPMAHRLLETMNSRLEVESKIGRGSRFYFIIDTPLFKQKATANIQPILGHKINPILIVEDNPLNQKLIEALLHKWNLPFELCTDGLQAYEACKKHPFSMILMDIEMPVMNGFESTKNIRKEKSINQDIPIIAISASSTKSYQAKAIKKGIDAFVSKPFNPDQLKQIIMQHLGTAKHTPQIEIAFKGMDHLMEMYDNDHNYLNDMLETFIDVCTQEIRLLNKYSDLNDYKKLKTVVHKIKPTFKMVGIDSLTNDSQYLEDQLQKDPNDAIENMLPVFMDKINQAIELIKIQLK